VNDPVIQFDNVSFNYGSVAALEDVSFSVSARELVSVIGPNGGGKTTLLKLMLGLLQPAAGSVAILASSPVAARRRIGYMPQYMRYDPRFPVSALDVVLMGRVERHRFGWYSAEDKRVAFEALEEVGLDALPGRPFCDLSGGQQQRVLIARALATQPELLLLDEPTANVDLLAESQFLDILHRLNERMTVLMVSHDLGFVADIVEKVICVNRHVVVHPTSVITGEVIQDIYGGNVRMVRHDHGCEQHTGQRGGHA